MPFCPDFFLEPNGVSLWDTLVAHVDESHGDPTLIFSTGGKSGKSMPAVVRLIFGGLTGSLKADESNVTTLLPLEPGVLMLSNGRLSRE